MASSTTGRHSLSTSRIRGWSRPPLKSVQKRVPLVVSAAETARFCLPGPHRTTMSEPAERATVGVVGERAGERVATAVADAGATPETGDLDTVLASAPDALVTVGEAAL